VFGFCCARFAPTLVSPRLMPADASISFSWGKDGTGLIAAQVQGDLERAELGRVDMDLCALDFVMGHPYNFFAELL